MAVIQQYLRPRGCYWQHGNPPWLRSHSHGQTRPRSACSGELFFSREHHRAALHPRHRLAPSAETRPCHAASVHQRARFEHPGSCPHAADQHLRDYGSSLCLQPSPGDLIDQTRSDSATQIDQLLLNLRREPTWITSVFLGGLKVQRHPLSWWFANVEIYICLLVAFGVLLSPQLQQELPR